MKRVITALVAIPAFLAMVWVGGWGFTGLMAVVVLGAQREVYDLFASDERRPGNLAGFLTALTMVFAPAWPPVLWATVPLGLFSLTWHMARSPGVPSLTGLAGSLAGLIYPALFLSALVAIRIPPLTVAWDPLVVTVGIFLLMWTADSAAYYAGRSLGRHALAPRLSPKKTWEGVAGGIVGAALLGWAMATWFDGNLAHMDWLVLALLVSVVGPAGDLFESALKRAAGVKDSSSLLPGHGGVLDRFDALVFVAPVVAIYLFLIA